MMPCILELPHKMQATVFGAVHIDIGRGSYGVHNLEGEVVAGRLKLRCVVRLNRPRNRYIAVVLIHQELGTATLRVRGEGAATNVQSAIDQACEMMEQGRAEAAKAMATLKGKPEPVSEPRKKQPGGSGQDGTFRGSGMTLDPAFARAFWIAEYQRLAGAMVFSHLQKERVLANAAGCNLLKLEEVARAEPHLFPPGSIEEGESP